MSRYNRACPLLRAMQVIRLTEESSDRPLVEALLDLDAQNIGATKPTVTSTEIHNIMGWREVAPMPKFVAAASKKKRPKHDETVLPRSARGPSGYYCEQKLAEGMKHKQLISPHAMCVAKEEYEYVPDNGMYRLSKGLEKVMSAPLIRPLKPAAMSAEQQRLQREIHRELRRELETTHQAEKMRQNLRSREQGGPTRATTGERLRGSTVRQTPRDVPPSQEGIELIAQKYSGELGKDGEVKLDSAIIPASGRSNDRSQLRSRGSEIGKLTEARISASREARRRTSSHRESLVELPPIDGPLVGRTVNQPNGYLESLSNRMNALDQEMRKDMYVFSRSQDDMFWAGIRSKAGRTQITKFMDFSGLPHFIAPMHSDAFSVKPIKRLQSKYKSGMVQDQDRPLAVRTSKENGYTKATGKKHNSRKYTDKTLDPHGNDKSLTESSSPRTKEFIPKAIMINQDPVILAHFHARKKPVSTSLPASPFLKDAPSSPLPLSAHKEQFNALTSEAVQLSVQGGANEVEEDPMLPEVSGKRLSLPVTPNKVWGLDLLDPPVTPPAFIKPDHLDLGITDQFEFVYCP